MLSLSVTVYSSVTKPISSKFITQFFCDKFVLKSLSCINLLRAIFAEGLFKIKNKQQGNFVRPSAKTEVTAKAQECDCDVMLKVGCVRDGDT
jgi:hypothetical protein